jgi:hypothetical protein
MAKTTRRPTPEERAAAEMHATALGRAWDKVRNFQTNGFAEREGCGPETRALALGLMALSGEYRAIANGAEIDL